MEKAFILAHISRCVLHYSDEVKASAKKKRQCMLVLAVISLFYTVQYPGPGKVLHMMKTGLHTIIKPRYPLRGMLGGYTTPKVRHVAVY